MSEDGFGESTITEFFDLSTKEQVEVIARIVKREDDGLSAREKQEIVEELRVWAIANQPDTLDELRGAYESIKFFKGYSQAYSDLKNNKKRDWAEYKKEQNLWGNTIADGLDDED